VVEGYVDVLTLAQAGVEEVVAPLGTALTADQLRMLRRFTDTVIACFDGDAAGRRAAARSFGIFVEAGLWGRGAFLPAGEDPDTYVRANGRAALDAVVAAAEPLVEAFISETAGPDPDAVGRRADAAREIARILKRVNNPFEHDVLARLAADRLGVRAEVLRGDAGVPGAPAHSEPRSPGADHALRDEQRLLVLMAIETPMLHRVRADGLAGDFREPAHREIAEHLIAADPAADIESRVQLLPPRLRDEAVRRLLGHIEDEDRQREFGDCVRILRRRRSQRLLEQLRAAESRGDHRTVTEIQRQMQLLRTESASTEKART
jgi:DNA primase